MGKRLVKIPLSKKVGASTVNALELLKRDLGAMGVQLTLPDPLSGGTLVFEYDDETHKRNAGRKKKAIPASSKLARKTQEQVDEWLLDASIVDIQEALGIGRATAYRRVNEARSRVEYAIVSLANADESHR